MSWEVINSNDKSPPPESVAIDIKETRNSTLLVKRVHTQMLKQAPLLIPGNQKKAIVCTLISIEFKVDPSIVSPLVSLLHTLNPARYRPSIQQRLRCRVGHCLRCFFLDLE